MAQRWSERWPAPSTALEAGSSPGPTDTEARRQSQVTVPARPGSAGVSEGVYTNENSQIDRFARVKMGKRQGRGQGGGGGHRDKRSRGGGGGGRGGGSSGTGWDARSSWPAAEKTSPSMESYYQMQDIVPDDQWLDFMASCRKIVVNFENVCQLAVLIHLIVTGAPLPTTFRISPCCTFADEIRSKLKTRYEEFKNEMVQTDEDGERQYPPQPMLWYPDELAWFMNLSKKALKKTPGLEKFHQYLVAETESGNITRQVDSEVDILL